MEEIEAKKNADIEKMEKRAELRKERDAAKANQPLVDLHLNSIPESYHEALKNGIVHVSRERTLGFSWLREGYDTGLGRSDRLWKISIRHAGCYGSGARSL